MATNTSILGLTKPTYAEDQDITVLNANSDLIDAEAGRLRANFAGTYSATDTYAVGDYCIYQGNLYRCTTAISSGEAWNSAHWSQVSAGDELSSANQAIAKLGQPAAESSTYNSLDSFKSGLISIVSGMNNGGVRKIRFGFSVTSIAPFKGYTWTCEIARATASYFSGIAYTYGTDVKAVEIKYSNGTWSIEQLESKITTISYRDQTVTSGACTIQYPTGMTDTSHSYIIQPIYKSGNLIGWADLLQPTSAQINLYVRVGSTTPANDSKVSFNLICIKN